MNYFRDTALKTRLGCGDRNFWNALALLSQAVLDTILSWILDCFNLPYLYKLQFTVLRECMTQNRIGPILDDNLLKAATTVHINCL